MSFSCMFTTLVVVSSRLSCMANQDSTIRFCWRSEVDDLSDKYTRPGYVGCWRWGRGWYIGWGSCRSRGGRNQPFNLWWPLVRHFLTNKNVKSNYMHHVIVSIWHSVKGMHPRKFIAICSFSNFSLRRIYIYIREFCPWGLRHLRILHLFASDSNMVTSRLGLLLIE